MKLFLKAACAAFILTVIFSLLPFQAACAELPEDVFRLHILANSDSEADQTLKLQVRDRVLEYSEQLFEHAGSREEAEKLCRGRLQEIADVAAGEVKAQGYEYPVKAELVNMYFTTRHYDSYTLPAGMYDALRITIGNGEGHNWWCVMFPSLCVSSQPDEQARQALSDSEYRVVKNEKHVYKFFIVELFENICHSFS